MAGGHLDAEGAEEEAEGAEEEAEACRAPGVGASHRRSGSRRGRSGPSVAVGEAVILLDPPLLLAGVSIVMGRERQQNDSLVRGRPSGCPAM